MEILYLHGFASYFKPNNNKIKSLEKLGNVHGYDILYEEGGVAVVQTAIDYCLAHQNIDIIVGTSLGGWLASQIGDRLGIPFVAINPSLDPQISARRHIGIVESFAGTTFEMTEEIVNTYYPFKTEGCGLILLDEGDELFDSNSTKQRLDQFFQIKTFPGGSHRFNHMRESRPIIQQFYDNAQIVYG